MAYNLAPVVLFVYNRPYHTEQVLRALMKNRLASESMLYIFSDGPVNGATAEQVGKIEDVRKLIRSKQWCKEVIISESSFNKGLADSIVSGVTEIIEKHHKAIILEDDVVTSVGFLQYINDALDFYENKEKVMHVSGYMYPHEKKLPETFFLNVPYPGGGWATWQRAWKYYINDAEYLYNYFNSASGWWKFNKFGGDLLQKQLIRNRTGEMKTWFIKWHATLLIHHGLTLYPGISLSNNIGFDDSGSHCPKIDSYAVENIADQIGVSEIPFRECKRAKTLIRRFYQGPFSLKKAVYSTMTRFIKKATIQQIKRQISGK